MDRKRACSEVSPWRDHIRRRRKPCGSSLFTGCNASLLAVSRPNGQIGRKVGQGVTRVAKRYELRAARSSRCEEVLRW
jgi:hypothetical protein